MQLTQTIIKFPDLSFRTRDAHKLRGYFGHLFKEHFEYRFETLWMALNENNYRNYVKSNQSEKEKLLKKVLTGNILSFYKGINYWTKQEILLKTRLEEHKTQFKDKTMLAFRGSFVCNAILPDYIGLGKAVSRGFGTILLN